jgi:beta-phosphoglucomutase-like phosphatase (HAD superfamily)
MIKAIVFDLDGTLVQTEILKAHSYGRAIEILTAGSVKEREVLFNFKSLVGLSRNEVVDNLIDKFSAKINTTLLAEHTSANTHLMGLRQELYDEMTSDPLLLPKFSCRFNLSLLRWARKNNFKTGLATMSYAKQVSKVLKILKVQDLFDHIITREGVSRGKPDPEIYLKMIRLLGINEKETLIIEDSVTGIQAAMNAGITVFAVTNSLTREKVNSSGLLNSNFIINDVKELQNRVLAYINGLAM